MTKPNAIVTGITGRMGREIARLTLDDAGLTLAGGTVRIPDKHDGNTVAVIGADGVAHDVPIAGTLGHFDGMPQVAIDFTAPDNTLALLDDSVANGIALVIGTTGFTPEQEEKIAGAAKSIPIVKAGNMSLGVNLLTLLVEQAAKSLGTDYDIEIHEAHHRHKKDAPSGTALMLGEAAAKGRGIDLGANAVHAREGQTGERPNGTIGFSVTRAGGIIGEHQVLFGSEEEVLSLSHTAIDRAVFARGAVEAAKWVVGHEPGLYAMRDVLGL